MCHVPKSCVDGNWLDERKEGTHRVRGGFEGAGRILYHPKVKSLLLCCSNPGLWGRQSVSKGVRPVLTSNEDTGNAEELSTLAHPIPAWSSCREVPTPVLLSPRLCLKPIKHFVFLPLFPSLTVPLFPHWALGDTSDWLRTRPPLSQDRAITHRSR